MSTTHIETCKLAPLSGPNSGGELDPPKVSFGFCSGANSSGLPTNSPLCNFTAPITSKNQNDRSDKKVVNMQSGSCVPQMQSLIDACLTNPSNCVCPITFLTSDFSDGRKCGIPTATFDIYIINKSDQTLNLVSNEITITDNEGNVVTPISNCWLGAPQPSIASNKESLARANVLAVECEKDVSIQVKLVYAIGTNDGFGQLEIDVCRFRKGVMGSGCDYFSCTTGFGALADGCKQGGASITGANSDSPYTFSDLKSNETQYVVTVNGGGSGDDIFSGFTTITLVVILAVFFIIILLLGFFYYLYSLRQ